MTSYSGALRHGSAISCISAVSAHEYHLHLICIPLVCLHMTAPHMFVLSDEAASSQVATDRFPEQKTITNGNKKRLIRTFYTCFIDSSGRSGSEG